jgi:hypothetical protein
MGAATDGANTYDGPPVGSFSGPQPTQLVVDPGTVCDYVIKLGYGQKVDPIEVVRLPDGREFITEGHHRYVASQLTGIAVDQKTIENPGPVGFNWSRVRYGKLDQ